MVKRLLLLVMVMLGCLYAKAQTSSDKEFLNQVSKDLIAQWDTEAIHNVLNLLNQGFEYNTEDINKWRSDVLKASKTAIITPYKGISDGYMLTIRPTSFLGHFKAVNGRWVCEKMADDLQFSFKDQADNTCIFRMTTGGKTKTIIVPYEYDEFTFDDDDTDDAFGFRFKGYKNIMKDVKLLFLELPEHLELSLTKDNKQQMLTTINFDLNRFPEDWDALTDGFMVSINSTLAKSGDTKENGTFEIGMNRLGYQPGTGIDFSFYAKNNGNQLLSFDLKAAGTLNLDDGLFDYSLEKGLGLKDLGMKSLKLNLDVLGRIQGYSSITDLHSFFNTMLSISKCEDEAEAEHLSAKLTKMMDGKFYYDKGTNANGSLGMQFVYDNAKEGWSLKPTISFTSDNSTYTMLTYFTKEDFPDIVHAVKTIRNDFKDFATAMRNSLKISASETTDIETLSTTDNPDQEAEIYTIGGQTVTSSSTLSSGTYVIKTTTGSHKVIVK